RALWWGGEGLDERQRDLWLRPEGIEDLREGLEAARRRADADHRDRLSDRLLWFTVLQIFLDREGIVADAGRWFARLAGMPAARLCLLLFPLGSARLLHCSGLTP